MDEKFNSIEELLETEKAQDDAFHNDCGYDVTETSNGVVIGNW